MKKSLFLPILGIWLNISVVMAAQDVVCEAVPRPIGSGIVMPEIARDHEEIYLRFLKGKLIYKPDPKSNNGMMVLPIADLSNPLQGTFDLSRCGDAGQYITISTGYRQGRTPADAKKTEIWIMPRFLIERDIANKAQHYQHAWSQWKKEDTIGLLWNWGGWDNLDWYWYKTDESLDSISNENLLEKYYKSTSQAYDWQHVPSINHSAPLFMLHF